MCDLEDIFSFGLTENSSECYKEFSEHAEKWFEYLDELLKWTFETIAALLGFLISVPLSLPIIAFMVILYGIRIVFYNLL